jgi:hypothetical protein
MLISFSQTIRMGMHDRCQNRPRQHRLCALAAQRWEDLSASLPLLYILDEQEKAQITRGLSARRADVLLDALLEEFDLELVDRKEWSSVYWYLSRVARARNIESEGQSRSWRVSWASGWADVAQAIHMVSLLLPLFPTRSAVDILFSAFGCYQRVVIRGARRQTRAGSL